MAEPHDITVIVEDFRAVGQANIIIDGITVVAGENGSGKSSISKLLYFLYRTVASYDDIVKRLLITELTDVSQFLDIMVQEYRVLEGSDSRETPRRYTTTLRRGIIEAEFIDEQVDNWLNAISTVEAYIINPKNLEIKISPARRHRIRRILMDVLKRDDKELDFKFAFDNLKELVHERFDSAQSRITLRPTALFIRELEEIFSENDVPKRFEVLEYGSSIVALNSEQLAIPYSIQNAIYIDSPMVFHGEVSSNQHWDDLLEHLQNPGNAGHPIADIIGSQIIKGQVTSDETVFSTEDYKFQRNDGEIFNLLDVATGVKSFSILKLLLKNGSITDKTLMIIDEPESNLHPQWVIEYARIIVLLNKHVGVKFFLATHNPDMVSAIRYISEKEGTLEKVNYYLAEKEGEQFKYNYKFLDKEIDPIFASFNIALERINQYGI